MCADLFPLTPLPLQVMNLLQEATGAEPYATSARQVAQRWLFTERADLFCAACQATNNLQPRPGNHRSLVYPPVSVTRAIHSIVEGLQRRDEVKGFKCPSCQVENQLFQTFSCVTLPRC